MPNKCLNFINGEDCIDRGCGADRCQVCQDYEELLALQHQYEDNDTDCLSIVAGKECIDRREPLSKMCQGCTTYWNRVSELTGKTIPECYFDATGEEY